MYIQTDNSINYTSLYRGGTIKQILSKKHSKKFETELRGVENSIRKKELHKKENVDIILNYNKQDGFYGIISSKAEGTPMHPLNKCPVAKNEESMNKFTKWVNDWNESYSPESLGRMNAVFEFIKNMGKK